MTENTEIPVPSFPPLKPMKSQVVKAGVACIVRINNTFLLMQRKGSHGAGSWSLPGGKIEFGECPVQAAVRELREETNLEALGASFVGYSSYIEESTDPQVQWVTLMKMTQIEMTLEDSWKVEGALKVTT